MEYKFLINDTEVSEPRGWRDLEISLIRDKTYHGIGKEASTSTLTFYGDGAVLLQNMYAEKRTRAEADFVVLTRCEGDVEYDEDPIFSGRINFGAYKATCGRVCSVTVPIEEQSCELLLRTRFEQKVDVDDRFAADRITGLTTYPGLNKELYLPPKALQARLEGYVEEDGDLSNIDIPFTLVPIAAVVVRPTYNNGTYNNIPTGQLVPSSYFEIPQINNGLPISPQLLFETGNKCVSGELDYTSRVKGSIKFSRDIGSGIILKHAVYRWDGVGEDALNDGTLVTENTLASTGAYVANTPVTFDDTITGSYTPAEGESIYFFIYVTGVLNVLTDNILTTRFDKETYCNIEGSTECPGSNAPFYMVHELLSRLSESVTNGCVRVKSQLYGRVDSMPFAFDNDGCGGLRALTSGLKIRLARDPKFFISLKELIDGLNAIDNIGYDVIPDAADRFIMRVEPAEFFYKNEQIYAAPDVAEINTDVDNTICYNQFDGGYSKWETDEANGLAELHSARSYRTGVETLKNTLQRVCNLIAGSYALELTRTTQFGDTNGKDTTYDNDAFILCLARNAYQLEVERDNILNPLNIFSPETQYNFRISPARNAMRWYKMLCNQFVDLGDTTNKLYFLSGNGNLQAQGEVDEPAYTGCKIETGVIKESQDLFVTNFFSPTQYAPIFIPEVVKFEYPLTAKEYFKIKENPYGYITYNCNGTQRKAYLLELKWKPYSGIANFTLRTKW